MIYGKTRNWAELQADAKSRISKINEGLVSAQESTPEALPGLRLFLAWKLLCLKMITETFWKKFPGNFKAEFQSIVASLKIAEVAFSNILASYSEFCSLMGKIFQVFAT
jgi:hypothetical protein